MRVPPLLDAFVPTMTIGRMEKRAEASIAHATIFDVPGEMRHPLPSELSDNTANIQLLFPSEVLHCSLMLELRRRSMLDSLDVYCSCPQLQSAADLRGDIPVLPSDCCCTILSKPKANRRCRTLRSVFLLVSTNSIKSSTSEFGKTANRYFDSILQRIVDHLFLVLNARTMVISVLVKKRMSFLRDSFEQINQPRPDFSHKRRWRVHRQPVDVVPVEIRCLSTVHKLLNASLYLIPAVNLFCNRGFRRSTRRCRRIRRHLVDSRLQITNYDLGR